MTTFASYGKVAPERQSEIIRGFGDVQPAGADSNLDDLFDQIRQVASGGSRTVGR